MTLPVAPSHSLQSVVRNKQNPNRNGNCITLTLLFFKMCEHLHQTVKKESLGWLSACSACEVSTMWAPFHCSPHPPSCRYTSRLSHPLSSGSKNPSPPTWLSKCLLVFRCWLRCHLFKEESWPQFATKVKSPWHGFYCHTPMLLCSPSSHDQ